MVRPEDMQLPHRLLKVVILSGNPISDNECIFLSFVVTVSSAS